MGGVKDSTLWSEGCELDELDAHLTPEELSETETLMLERQTIAAELRDLAERMKRTLDRVKYYGENVDADEFEFLHREVLRIQGNLG
jgi:hypothetical protein